MILKRNSHIGDRISTSITLLFSILVFTSIGIAGDIIIYQLRGSSSLAPLPAFSKWIIQTYGYNELDFSGNCFLFSSAMATSFIFSWSIFPNESHRIFRKIAACIWIIFVSFISVILVGASLPFMPGLIMALERPETPIKDINNIGIRFIIVVCICLVIYKIYKKIRPDMK